MSKYENFNHLVAKNLDTAQLSIQMDICYLIGIMDGRGADKISMIIADSEYHFDGPGKGIDFFISEKEGAYILTAQSGDTQRVLITVSVTYERYQIAEMLSEAWLTFYMNTHVKEINDEM